MTGITIDLSQFEPVLKKFATLSQELQAQIDNEIANAAEEFASGARRVLQSSLSLNNNRKTSRLTGATQSKKVPGVLLTYEVFSQTNYAAYNEWGTITHVSVPADLVDIAIQYKGQGIRKTGGMRAKHYFFSQQALVVPKLINNLHNVIEQTLSK